MLGVANSACRLITKTSRHSCLTLTPQRSIWNWKVGWLFRPPKRQNVKEFENYYFTYGIAFASCSLLYVIGYKHLYKGIPISLTDTLIVASKQEFDSEKAIDEEYNAKIEAQLAKAHLPIESPGPALPQWPPPFQK